MRYSGSGPNVGAMPSFDNTRAAGGAPVKLRSKTARTSQCLVAPPASSSTPSDASSLMSARISLKTDEINSARCSRLILTIITTSAPSNVAQERKTLRIIITGKCRLDYECMRINITEVALRRRARSTAASRLDGFRAARLPLMKPARLDRRNAVYDVVVHIQARLLLAGLGRSITRLVCRSSRRSSSSSRSGASAFSIASSIFTGGIILTLFLFAAAYASNSASKRLWR